MAPGCWNVRDVPRDPGGSGGLPGEANDYVLGVIRLFSNVVVEVREVGLDVCKVNNDVWKVVDDVCGRRP